MQVYVIALLTMTGFNACSSDSADTRATTKKDGGDAIPQSSTSKTNENNDGISDTVTPTTGPVGPVGESDPPNVVVHKAGKWSSISDAGSPSARHRHKAFFSGDKMIVWGGRASGGVISAAGLGAIYNVKTNKWEFMQSKSAPAGEFNNTMAHWLGEKLFVFGNEPSKSGLWNAALNLWSEVNTSVGVAYTSYSPSVFTGSSILVFGGGGSTNQKKHHAYDIKTNTWKAFSAVNAPKYADDHSLIWTGSKMIVWGGDPEDSVDPTNKGGGYDPIEDKWQPTTTVNAPTPRREHYAVWTGTKMIVWDGCWETDSCKDDKASGGIYDPKTDSWTTMSNIRAPLKRRGATVIWTGKKMVVWGGGAPFTPFNDGAEYDPSTDQWQPMAIEGAPAARYEHSAVWTGSCLIVWGGVISFNPPKSANDGAKYCYEEY